MPLHPQQKARPARHGFDLAVGRMRSFNDGEKKYFKELVDLVAQEIVTFTGTLLQLAGVNVGVATCGGGVGTILPDAEATTMFVPTASPPPTPSTLHAARTG